MPLDVSALPDKAAFAAANGWVYSATGGTPDFVGSMFDYLLESHVTDVFQVATGSATGSATGPATEVGIVTGKVGGEQKYPGTGGLVSMSFSTSDVVSRGYMAIELKRQLPQYVLDAKSNDDGPLSSIVMPIAGGQTISLEGDFDNYFTLYGPAGYETDARYVFTPDLMGLLIDETGDFDVEIVGNKLFVYAPGEFDLSSPTLWRRLDRIRTVVGAKALRQTDMYVDSKPVVEGGQRLRMGFFGSRSKVGFILILALGMVLIIGVAGFVVSSVLFSMGP